MGVSVCGCVCPWVCLKRVKHGNLYKTWVRLPPVDDTPHHVALLHAVVVVTEYRVQAAPSSRTAVLGVLAERYSSLDAVTENRNKMSECLRGRKEGRK